MASSGDFMGGLGMDDQDFNASDYMFDSPQPTPASQPSTTDGQNLTHLSVPQQAYSAPSSASEESSSQSSSSAGSTARRKRKTSSTSSPNALFGGGAVPPTIDEGSASDFKVDRMMTDMDDTFNFEDTNFPMGAGMDTLSLGPMSNPALDSNFDFGNTQEMSSGFTPGPFADNAGQNFSSRNVGNGPSAQSLITSPEMSAHPSKFMIGDSREESPSSANMFTSHESSPANFMSHNSPFSGNSDGFGPTAGFNGLNFNSSPMNYSGTNKGWAGSGSTYQGNSSQSPGPNWPCNLSVDKIPEKSRVETQIPIKLYLSPMPEGVTKLHLPTHTISKPKLLAKPPYSKADDTLELSTMLVCASAMLKEGNLERAFLRAASEETPVKKEDGRRNSTGDIQFDDNDPNKPLNGGPVNICQGCITRERKRAARKKNKKAEEEEAWAKDEARRVIVFNTTEVKEWASPAGQDTSTLPDAASGALTVEAPMRIACYCRHQSEKMGFQVIFTIKTSEGQVLAQAISESIMITDDHKQPTAQTQHTSGVVVPNNAQYSDTSMFSPTTSFNMIPSIQQAREPFKNSWSTNDLQAMARNFAPQVQQGAIRKQYSQVNTPSRTTSTTMTPRNLSRPASPTDPQGHSVKKRRSDGPGFGKVPTGLTMTRRDNTISPTSAGQGPTSAGPTSGNFNFGNNPGPFGPSLDSYQTTTLNMPPQYYNGPQSAMPGLSSSAYGSPTNENAPFQYSTAPSSQHPSRAPSPTSIARMSSNHSQTLIQQAASLLGDLPHGYNEDRPPAIHQVIPNEGPTSGGTEVTVLGANFFRGLEVVFGDNTAAHTAFWGDTTLVCRTPPAAQAGFIPVTFEHDRRRSPASLIPARAHFKYTDQDKNQMLALAGMIAQQGANGRNISHENLMMQGYQGGFPNFPGNIGPSSGGQYHQASTMPANTFAEAGSEVSMMRWLEAMDMRATPLQPNFNTTLPTGVTLLILASRLGYARFGAGLLARGANPDCRDKGGYTALMSAAMTERPHIVRHLLLKGADPSIRSLNGFTAIDLSSSKHVSSVLMQMTGLSDVVAWKDYSILRRPSSTPSLDTLSGLSGSSQVSLSTTLDDRTPQESRDQDQDQLWMRRTKKNPSVAQKIIHSNLLYPHDPWSISPTAALATWREQVITQIHHLHQNLQWNMPTIQFPALPDLLNMPDYQHYPVVRRLSDLLSPPSPPPSYEDACAGANREKSETRESRFQAAVGAIAEIKHRYTFGGSATPVAPTSSSIAVVTSKPLKERHEDLNLRFRGRKPNNYYSANDAKYSFIMISLLLITLGWISMTRMPVACTNVKMFASYSPLLEHGMQILHL